MNDDPQPTPPLPPDREAIDAQPPPPEPAGGQTVVMRTDAPHLVSVDVRSIDAVKFQVIDVTIASNVFSQPSPMRLLSALLRNVDEDAWARTGGRLLCDLTVPQLMEKSGLGRSTVYKASGELVQQGLVEKSVGGGRDSNVYEIFPPGQRRVRSPRVETDENEAAESSAPELTLTPRQRAPYERSEDAPEEPRQTDEGSTPVDGWRAPMSGRVPSTVVDPRRALMSGRVPSTPVDGWRAPMSGRVARAQRGPQPSTQGGPHPSTQRGPEATAVERERAPADAGAGASAAAIAAAAEDGGDSAAAAAGELRRLGFARATIDELGTLTTTTPLVVLAAASEAAKRPEDRRMGLIVALVRDPARISPKHLERARAQLAARAAATAGPPPPPVPVEALDVADRRLIAATPPDVVAAVVAAAIAAAPSDQLRGIWQRKGLDSTTLRAHVATEIRNTRSPQPPTMEAPL